MRRNNRIDWFFCIFILLMGGALASRVQAIEVSGLYEADVEVIDRNAQTFRGATQDALAEVIVRISGSSRAIESPDVVAALSKPDRYLLQFGYEKLPIKDLQDSLLLQEVAPDRAVAPELLLKLQFDEKAINQLLRRAGLPIWASNRPEVLLWLGAELDGQRQLVSPSSAVDLSNLLVKESQRRGLPLSMPLYDLQDQAVVSIGDIWGMFTDRLIEASNRYPATGVLMAKIYQNNDGQWVGSWTLNVDGQGEWFDSKGDTSEEVIAAAVDWATDQMAAKFAILASADDSDAVMLQISGIHELTSYAQVSKYLDGLVAIRQVQMQSLQGDVITFQVYLESDKEQLQQSLKLDAQLQFMGEKDTVISVKAITDQAKGNLREIDQPLPDTAPPPEGILRQPSTDLPLEPLSVGLQANKPKRRPVLLYRWNG